MIEPANRIASVNEYYFSKKLKEIELIRAKGIKVLNLGIGNPDLPPSEETLEKLKELVGQASNHGYQSYIGHKALREEFSNWYKRYFNVELDCNSEILPLIGSKEGVMHISMAFLNPGDGVLIPDPSYPAYEAVANLVGAKSIRFNLTEDNNWFPDFEEIEKHDLSKVKLMWVNYPNMPTGRKIGLSEFQALIDFGFKHNILICNDNPYSFILNKDLTSILQIPRAREVAIELNSMSKSHNMAGWRIGVLVSNPTFVQHVLKVKSNVDSGMFLPLQLAAAKALNCGEDWYTKNNEVYQNRRKIAESIMDRVSCVYNPDQSGMFIWAKIPDGYKDSFEFADKLLYDYDMFITPGLIFGNNGKRYIRISLASKDEDLLEAQTRLKAFKNES
jgi:LL-diaminopimelate aminotransferase